MKHDAISEPRVEFRDIPDAITGIEMRDKTGRKEYIDGPVA